MGCDESRQDGYVLKHVQKVRQLTLAKPVRVGRKILDFNSINLGVAGESNTLSASRKSTYEERHAGIGRVEKKKVFVGQIAAMLPPRKKTNQGIGRVKN